MHTSSCTRTQTGDAITILDERLSVTLPARSITKLRRRSFVFFFYNYVLIREVALQPTRELPMTMGGWMDGHQRCVLSVDVIDQTPSP